MYTKEVLTLLEVGLILASARAEAARSKLPVSIAVVDDGGHPLALERTDDAAPLSVYVAMEKARTAALARRESKVFEDMINGGRTAFLSAPSVCSLEGAVPVIVNGRVLGAVGVSGATASDDAKVARAGADSVVS
jgi:glc operon protein GlcG